MEQLRLTGSCAPIILGVAPEHYETRLELWERLRTGREDRHAAAKAVSRAACAGLLGLLTDRLEAGSLCPYSVRTDTSRGTTAALQDEASPHGSETRDRAPCERRQQRDWNHRPAGWKPATSPSPSDLFQVSKPSTAQRVASAGWDKPPRYSFLAANPDGWCRSSTDPQAMQEQDKSAGVLLVVKELLWYTLDEFATCGPPKYLTAVVQHELLATGCRRARWGLRLAGGAWRTSEMGASETFQAGLLAAEAAFVASLERGEPPMPGSAADLDVVKRLWPHEDAGTARLSARAAAAWARVKQLRAGLHRHGDARRKLEALVRAEMGAARYGLLPGGGRLALRSVPVPGGRSGRRLVEVR